MSIKIFTEKDYIKCLMLYSGITSIKKLNEEDAKYYINNKHDKVFKTILQKPKEAEFVIKKVLKLDKKINLSLVLMNNEHITMDFRGKQVDVLYKLKDKEVYFIIEHQSTKDRNMPYRIMEYEVEVMRESFLKEGPRVKKYAKVISIVIYTGQGQWNTNQSIVEVQEKFGYKIKPRANYTGIGEYNLLDINDYTKEELLEEGMFISKIMLLEKAKGEKELIETLDKIIPTTKEEEKGDMVRILKYILVRELGEEKAKKYINILRGGDDDNMLAVIETLKKDREKSLREARKQGREEGENNMLAVIETLKKDREKSLKEARKQGREEGIIQTAKNMLKEKIDIETIEKITKLNRKQFM